MPFKTYKPRLRLSAGVDLRQWAGLEVFNRGGTLPFILPSFGVGEGLFKDLTGALHGRGFEKELGARLTEVVAAWDPAATMSAGIDSSDRFFLVSNKNFWCEFG